MVQIASEFARRVHHIDCTDLIRRGCINDWLAQHNVVGDILEI